MKQLTIIVISYNTKKLLQQTLASLPQHQDWDVVVVDNASTDGSADAVESVRAVREPPLHIIRNSKNVGFAAANNQVIRDAQSKYVLLLNSDTVVEAGALEALIDYMEAHPRVAVVSPKIILKNGRLDIACHRGMPTPWNSFCYYAGLEKLFSQSKLFGGYHQTYLPMDKVHEIEATAGTAMMVRTAAIKEVGLLDERFFMYAEDLDWCLRFTKAGWKIVYYPLVTVHHYKSQSGMRGKGRGTRDEVRGYFFDTMKQFYEKHYASKYPAWLKALVYKGIDFKKWLATR